MKGAGDKAFVAAAETPEEAVEIYTAVERGHPVMLAARWSPIRSRNVASSTGKVVAQPIW